MILALAMVLDAVLGEPKWLWSKAPHPAVLMGRAVEALDQRMNRGEARRVSGVLALALLLVGALVLGGLLAALPVVVELLVVAVLLAQRSLTDHVRDVADGLRMSLAEGRRSVAKIVGRETVELDRSGVARAALESAAENLSDGVIAPIFWYLVLGLPGILAYKVLNTADSMIGHRTERHEEFGWAAARLDDLANFLPARLTAALIWAATGGKASWAMIGRDAPLHRSPNAGWPEAALAHGMDVALSGPRVYHGTPTDDPFVHPEGARDLGADEIDKGVSVLWRVWWIVLIAVIIAAVLV